MTTSDQESPLRAKSAAGRNYHVMVDLETWATGPAAIPIAIGAVKFDPLMPFHPKGADAFYVAIDPRTAAPLGLHIEPDTIMWWMDPKQRAALDHWLQQPMHPISEALQGFMQWYGVESLPTWAKGPSFDNVILQTAFRVSGLIRPWKYSHDRDLRSVRGLLPPDWKPALGPLDSITAHDAL